MKTIPLTQGFEAIVDDADFEWISQWKWHYRANGKAVGYAARNLYLGKRANGNPLMKMILMHRLIVEAEVKDSVDHQNQNTMDNRRQNLRKCSHSQNCRNRRKRADGVDSKFKGVKLSFGRFVARIQTDDGRKHLGTFPSELIAAQAYDKAALLYHGDFARLNFPRENYANA